MVVTIFLPMIPQIVIDMLACARIGAIHSVVFSAFSANALKDRILDCDSKMVITSDIGYHGGRIIDLKSKTDQALHECGGVEKVIVFNRGGSKVDMKPGRDLWWTEEIGATDITDEIISVKKWTQRTPYLYFIPAEARENQKGYCIQPEVICFIPTLLQNIYLI